MNILGSLRPRPSLATNLALLAGLMMTTALPPFPATVVLAPLALGLFFYALIISRHPGRTGWVFGLAHQVTLLHWLFFLDPSKSIPSRALVPVQALAAIGYVALFYLLLGWVFGQLRRRLKGMSLWMLPALWAAMEALRGVGELGFPWCLSGATVVTTPLMVLYRTAGEPGVGLGMALLAVAVLGLRGRWARRHSRGANPGLYLVGGALLWWGFLGLGALFPLGTSGDGAPAPLPLIRAAAIQPNVALADKWVAGKIEATRGPLTSLTRDAAGKGARFVVWPETAVPAYLRYDPDLLAWVRKVARDNRTYLFTGFPDAERSPEGKVLRYNSSGLFSPQGNLLDQYAKYHLLPMGEVMPFERYLPFLAGVDVGQAEWTPGKRPEPLLVGVGADSFRFSCLICFESAFGNLARASVIAGSRLLVIITNDGWFGHSAGPVQHARLALIRAAACGVPVIRCANNGISFICDARGRILDWLPVGERGFVRADIPAGKGDTLFVRWGLDPLWIFLVVWLALGWVLECRVAKEEA